MNEKAQTKALRQSSARYIYRTLKTTSKQNKTNTQNLKPLLNISFRKEKKQLHKE